MKVKYIFHFILRAWLCSLRSAIDVSFNNVASLHLNKRLDFLTTEHLLTSTEFVTDLDSWRKMIISEPILTTYRKNVKRYCNSFNSVFLNVFRYN